MEYFTELLAVRHFNPRPGEKKSAETVLLLLKDLYEEVNLTIQGNQYGSTTDAGPEVRRLCGSLLKRSITDENSILGNATEEGVDYDKLSYLDLDDPVRMSQLFLSMLSLSHHTFMLSLSMCRHGNGVSVIY